MRIDARVLCAVAAAALIAGCGGDDEPADTADTTVPTETAPVTTLPATPPSTIAAEEAEAQEQAEARARQRRERARSAERAVRAIAIATDVETISIKAEKAGAEVTVALEHQFACRMDDEDAQAFKRGVKAAAPRVKRVRLRGESSKKQTLEAYREKSCRLRTADKAPIILDRKGRGDSFLEGLDVSADEWTIEYGSSAKRFRLVVIDESDRTVLSVGKPDSGLARRTVKGSGSFAVRVTSSGRWTLRVRDGV